MAIFNMGRGELLDLVGPQVLRRDGLNVIDLTGTREPVKPKRQKRPPVYRNIDHRNSLGVFPDSKLEQAFETLMFGMNRELYDKLVPQYPIINIDTGHWWKIDYILFGVVAIEIDGGNYKHGGGKHGHSKDKLRQNEMQRRGFTVVRFGGDTVKKKPAVVCETVEAALKLVPYLNNYRRDIGIPEKLL